MGSTTSTPSASEQSARPGAVGGRTTRRPAQGHSRRCREGLGGGHAGVVAILCAGGQRHLLASFVASIAARICAVLGRTLISGSECAQRTTPVRSMRKSDGIAISWCVLPE